VLGAQCYIVPPRLIIPVARARARARRRRERGRVWRRRTAEHGGRARACSEVRGTYNTGGKVEATRARRRKGVEEGGGECRSARNRETRELNCLSGRMEVVFYKARCKIKCALSAAGWHTVLPNNKCSFKRRRRREKKRASGRDGGPERGTRSGREERRTGRP